MKQSCNKKEQKNKFFFKGEKLEKNKNRKTL